MENISTSQAKASPIYSYSNDHDRKLKGKTYFIKVGQKTPLTELFERQLLSILNFNLYFSSLCLLVSWHVDGYLFKGTVHPSPFKEVLTSQQSKLNSSIYK